MRRSGPAGRTACAWTTTSRTTSAPSSRYDATTGPTTRGRRARSTASRGWTDADIDYVLGGHNWGGTVNWIASPTLLDEFIVGYASLDSKQQTYPDDWLAQAAEGPDRRQPAAALPGAEPAERHSGDGLRRHEHRSQRGDRPLGGPLPDGEHRRLLDGQRQPHQDPGRATSSRPAWRSSGCTTCSTHSGPSDVWSGRFNFAHNTRTPRPTRRIPYANALLGYFNTYTESTNRTQYSPVTPILEFYAQDTWKASRRLTLDLGVRFTVGLQQYQAIRRSSGGPYQSSSFVPTMYDPARGAAPLPARARRHHARGRRPAEPDRVPARGPDRPDRPRHGRYAERHRRLRRPRLSARARRLPGHPARPPARVRLGRLRRREHRGARRVRRATTTRATAAASPGTCSRTRRTCTSRRSRSTEPRRPIATRRARSRRRVSPGRSTAATRRRASTTRRWGSSAGSRASSCWTSPMSGRFGRHIGATTQLNNLPYGKRFEASSLDPTQQPAAGAAGRLPASLPGIRRHPVPQLRRQLQLPRPADVAAAPVRQRLPARHRLHLVEGDGLQRRATRGT